MGWVDNASPEVNDESQYPMIIAICATLSVLSLTIYAARIWVRLKNHGLAADDWMATLSVVFALLYAILCIVQTKYGLGLAVKKRPAANLIPYTRTNYAGRPIYQLGISFFKISLLLSYLRLLKGTHHKIYRLGVRIAMGFVFTAHLGCALTLVLACQPVHKSWNPKTPGKCIASGPSFTAYAIITIISDVLVILLPIPILLQLMVSRSKKLGLIVIFLLGFFTTLCSVFRYTQINRIQNGDGNSTMLIVWGVIEFNVGNIVSSLPSLAPIFLRKAREYKSKYAKSRGNGYGVTGNSGHKGYMLSSIPSNGKAARATSHDTGSEENILKPSPDGSIVKSVTYMVHFSHGNNVSEL